MAAPDEDQRFIKPFILHKSAKSLSLVLCVAASIVCSERLNLYVIIYVKAIPLAFNEYFPDPLPNTVELLDYYGRSWTIRMKKRGETVFLTVGWENFVKDNELEDGKMMEFIYDCDRTFYVVIFGHGGVSELRVFPQAVVDVGDYATGEEEEEEEKNKSN
nr:unnamed protein product [Brassica rapa]